MTKHLVASNVAGQAMRNTSAVLSSICDPASIGQVFEITVASVSEKKVRPVLVIEKDIHLCRTGDVARNDGCILATLKTCRAQTAKGRAGAPRPPVVPTIPDCGAMSRKRVFDPG